MKIIALPKKKNNLKEKIIQLKVWFILLSYKLSSNKRRKVFLKVYERIQHSPSIGLCVLVPQIIMEDYKKLSYKNYLEKAVYMAVHNREIFKELEYSRCVFLALKYKFKKPEKETYYYKGEDRFNRINWTIAILKEYFNEMF